MPDECFTNSPLHISSLTGEPLSLGKSRIAVVSKGEIPKRPDFRGSIVKADLRKRDDVRAIEAINEFFWESMEQDVFGRTYKVLDCDSYFAIPENPEPDYTDSGFPETHGIAGHMGIFGEESFLHIVVLHAWPQWHGRGVGYRLIATAIDEARKRGYTTIKLGTTNDNIPAIYFYQRVGFVIEAIREGELDDEHEGNMLGFAGIPINRDVELRLDL